MPSNTAARPELEEPSEEDLEACKEWLLHSFLNKANTKTQVASELYAMFLKEGKPRGVDTSSSSIPGPSVVPKQECNGAVSLLPANKSKNVVRRAKQGPEPEVIELSSDDDDEPGLPVTKKRPHSPEVTFSSRKQMRSNESSSVDPGRKKEIIEIIDSDDEKKPVVSSSKRSTAGSVAKRRKVETKNVAQSVSREGKDIVTKKTHVDKVVNLTKVPSRWPVPNAHEKIAYVLDFNDNKEVLKKARDVKEGKTPKGLDAFLKTEDQDSWGKGTNGSTTKDVPLIFLGMVPTRRSVHQCNGGFKCEFFDPEILADYERADGTDLGVTCKIFEQELEQNRHDEESALGLTASFCRVIDGMKCQNGNCPGRPILKPLRQPPSMHGKNHFIGCSSWQPGDTGKHLYAPVPSNVDETLLFQFLNKSTLAGNEWKAYSGPCYSFHHPRHGRQKRCMHTHICDGKLVIGQMISHPCPVRKIVYTSKDPENLLVVVIFEGRHNHPPWPEEKPTADAKDDLIKCYNAFGILGATPEQLDAAPSTITLLGMKLSEKYPAYRNKRALQIQVKEERAKSAPTGFQWEGIVDKYERDQKSLKSNEQYIWHLRMEGDLRLVVTANPYLATLVHQATYLVCDFTFKQVQGDLNEFEVVIWHARTEQRATIARIYCNRMTADAFDYIFEGLFKAVEQATGHPIRFKAFDNARGNICGIILDMEAAQVQGLGRALLRLNFNQPNTSEITENDPDALVQHVLKLCTVHFNRSVDKLGTLLNADVIEYLKKFRALNTLSDIQAWRTFCESHPCKELRDWFSHKSMYKWLLPGYNRLLSPMRDELWDITPSHTNLVETAHAATNRRTSIALTPLDAVERARVYDAGVAASISAATESCILPNRNNSGSARLGRSIGRQNHAAQRRKAVTELDNTLENLKEKISLHTDASQDLRTKLKDLTEQRKALSRSPRKPRAASTKFNDVPIPPIRGLCALRSSPDNERTPEPQSTFHQSEYSSTPPHDVNFDEFPQYDRQSPFSFEPQLEIGRQYPCTQPVTTTSAFDDHPMDVTIAEAQSHHHTYLESQDIEGYEHWDDPEFWQRVAAGVVPSTETGFSY